MEYKSHQANAKGQKKKKKIIFRCWDSNLKISKPYKFVLQQMLVSYDGIKIRSRLIQKGKKNKFRCQDSILEIPKPYKFVLQQMLVSYDGIYITSSLCERAK
jgi:hypothetical protein